MSEKQPAETTETAPPTIIEDLEATWDKMEAAEAADIVEAKEPEPEKEPAKEPEAKAETTEQEAEPEAEAEAQAEAPEEGEAGADPVEPPHHWDEAQKADFEALPEEARPLYLQKSKSLEAGYNKKFEELANDRKALDEYRGFKDMFEPVKQKLAMAGTNPEAYTRQLLATADMIAQDPEAVITQLAKQYGVNINTGKSVPDADEDDEFADPLTREIREVNAKVEGLSSQLNQSQQQAAANQQQTVEREWQAFVNAKGEGDADAHPHAAELRNLIGTEITVMPEVPGETTQDTIRRAYDKVKWTVPELRESLLASQSREKDAEREKQRKADLQKAKKAGDVVKSKSAPVADEADKPAETRIGELERVWDQLEQASG